MRVLFDGTPLLGQRTGIGRYTASLADALAATVDLRLFGLTLSGWRALRSAVPHATRATGLPAPAGVLSGCWSRTEFPPVELFAGSADVVHGTNFALPPSIRVPGVITVHDLSFLDDPRHERLTRLVRRGVRRASVVCTPTASVAEAVRDRLDVPRTRITVTPLGVDGEWFDAAPPDAGLRARHQLPEEYLVFVGSGGERKGLRNLRQALTGEDFPPLVVVGPGEHGTFPGEQRTGYLPEPELRSVVAGARALLLPARDEGFGLPALEALACGVPVVCSDVPSLREVTGGHAQLHAFGDADSLRAALRKALATGGDAAARRTHAAGFTWRACADATLDAYRRA